MFFKIFQLSLIPIMVIIARIFVKFRNIELEYSRIDKSKYRYIFVSNHQGMMDPFLIGISLPLGVNLKLTPYRYLVANRFFHRAWLRPLLRAYGCYPANKHAKLKYGLAYTRELIEKGQTIFIFPEGRISKYDREHKPKQGVRVFANMQDTYLIPVRVKWDRSRGVFKSYSIAVGNPFSGKDMTPGEIMDVIFALKFN